MFIDSMVTAVNTVPVSKLCHGLVEHCEDSASICWKSAPYRRLLFLMRNTSLCQVRANFRFCASQVTRAEANQWLRLQE